MGPPSRHRPPPTAPLRTDDAPARELRAAPRRADGGVDADAVAAALRRHLGRLHRFDPASSGATLLMVPRGQPSSSLPQVDPDATAGAVTAVVAVPYRGAPSVDTIAAVVTIRDDRVWVAGADDIADIVAAAPAVARAPAPRATAARESMGRAAYVAAVERVLEHIAAGDAYVVNIAQHLATTWSGDVHDLGTALRAVGPAPHAAVVELTDGAGLASVSPETFLRGRGRDLTIRPIKGTRARGATAADDDALRRELLASEKERAENVMIVDLERNDLGRVCDIGSITVPELCTAEPHPTVWQLVSTVTGRLRRDLTYADAIVACAPCGSVTGAPKHRAMQIIDRLEPTPRGWYCGAIGWMGPGALELAVAIRTAVLEPDGRASYGIGAGIVADSDPHAEHAETLVKAAAFCRAIGAAAPHLDR